MSVAVEVSIRYYAILREERGRDTEQIETDAATLGDLYDRIASRHGFSLPRERLRVAVDTDFAEWGDAPTSGSEIVFIPPVAGG